MQLSAYLVDWDLVTRLTAEGKLEDAFDEDVDFGVPGPPWRSDSCIWYTAVGEVYAFLRPRLEERARSNADPIFSALINETYTFPRDLGPDVEPELVAGSVSPDTAHRLFERFSALDYAALDAAYDFLPPDERERLGIGPEAKSQEEFTGYLRQWEELLRAAVERRAGVFIHLG